MKADLTGIVVNFMVVEVHDFTQMVFESQTRGWVGVGWGGAKASVA